MSPSPPRLMKGMGNHDDKQNIFHDLQFDLIIAALSYSIFATMSPPRSMKGIGYHDDKQNIFHDLQFVLHIHSLPRIDCKEIWLAVTNGKIDNDWRNAKRTMMKLIVTTAMTKLPTLQPSQECTP